MPAAIEMRHEVDPKTALLAAIGDLSDVEIFNNQVLIAVYIRPERTKGGIIWTDNTRDEDKYQSKVGLILKMGSDAFIDPANGWFHNVIMDDGDWVVYKPSDGWQITVNGVLCRILDDVNVRARVTQPDAVW